MDALVEFLFKYHPAVWKNGRLALSASKPTVVAAVVVGVAVLVAAVTYWRVPIWGTRTNRGVLAGMRILLGALLAFMLLRPVLVVARAFGRGHVVGVLVDDSRSMQVADMGNRRTRADVIRSLLGGPDSALYKALAGRFTVRLFRVGGVGAPMTGNVDALPFDASTTRLAASLEETRRDLARAPLAGIVLLSDGADHAPDELDATLRMLKTRRVPVYTVGVGQPRLATDLEISRVDAPRAILKGTSIVVTVSLLQRGLGGAMVPVVVEDSGRIVGLERVTLPKDGEATTVRIPVLLSSVGVRLLRVRVPVQPNEQIVDNNAQTTTVVVRDQRAKILYIEGEPRHETKFLRHALDEDDNLQLVTLVRVAKDKLLRLGARDARDGVEGFPATREELFAYDGLVLGSIEAGFFGPDRLQMIADFVGIRGGGLLMLGGRASFAEGGYAKTVLADVLPVLLPKERTAPKFRTVKVALTPTGALEPMMQVASTEELSAVRWKSMPAVSSVNRILGVKPGASTFMVDDARDDAGAGVVLASQRYGLGTAFAFPIQDSWVWQMDPSLALDDATHKTFWRQVFRTLVHDAPGRVVVNLGSQLTPGGPLHITAEVADNEYGPANGAAVVATVIAPSGAVAAVPLEWSGLRGGEYRAVYQPAEVGIHRVRVTARMNANSVADTVISDPAVVDIGAPNAEFMGAELRTSLLQRIAEETGGRYYTAAAALSVANDLAYPEHSEIPPQRLDLWDMPIVLLGIVLLLAGEWIYRQRRGLI